LIEAELQPGTEFVMGGVAVRFEEVEMAGER
jgi:hypothetical protein